MAETTTLKNTDRNRTFQATYYPEQIARRTTDRLYSVTRMRSPNGKLVSVKQPYSFEIPPGQSASVHSVALHLRQVKRALKSGWLKREQPAPVAPAVVAAPADSSSRRSRREK